MDIISPEGKVTGKSTANLILLLEVPSKSRSGMGGMERSGTESFCAIPISKKQWEEPLSISVFKIEFSETEVLSRIYKEFEK